MPRPSPPDFQCCTEIWHSNKISMVLDVCCSNISLAKYKTVATVDFKLHSCEKVAEPVEAPSNNLNTGPIKPKYTRLLNTGCQLHVWVRQVHKVK